MTAKGLAWDDKVDRPSRGLTRAQPRMARTALPWSLDDAEAASGLSRRTILRVEQAKPVLLKSMDTLRRAYEAAGVRFSDGGVFPPA